MKVDKEQVKRHFSKSLDTYDQEAAAQQLIVDHLLSLMPEDYSPGEALEIGCGTGYLTKKLIQNNRDTSWWINDLVDDVREGVGEEINSKGCFRRFLPGDAEQIDFPGNLNLIISASTVQWFHHLDQFITKVHSSLSKNGWFVFSSFGPRNFHELRSIRGGGLEYFPLKELGRMVEASFDVIQIEEDEISLEFDSVRDVLEHLKKTGVNATATKCWTRTEMQEFIHEYESRYKTASGKVTLTYHPIYVVAQKK
ncbi:malonyl-[acyl-carrier protein] O-methyltransferase BioC [Puteibacter caeruleilacunae]|nr:malonyl-[acyl-carrier protein] O-methyltransferase BioC [Puteibacter caeruleilacunae]